MYKRKPTTLLICDLRSCHNIFRQCNPGHRFCSRPHHELSRRAENRPTEAVCAACGCQFDIANRTGNLPQRCPSCARERRHGQVLANKKARRSESPLPPCRSCGVADVRRRGTGYCEECNDRRGARGKPRPRDLTRAATIKNMYGMTLAEFDKLLAEQGGHCAFCEKTIESNGHALSVDHDHTTGAVRGILCAHHNKILVDGLTPELLRAMADYLEAEPYHAGRSRLQLAS